MAAMTEHDWYTYLRLPPEATTRDIEQAVERVETEFGPIWGAVANFGLYPTPLGFGDFRGSNVKLPEDLN